MKKIILGMALWGDAYIERFFNYCLPSLFASGNLPFLCKHREVIFLIHTMSESKSILKNHFDRYCPSNVNCKLVFVDIDPEWVKSDKYMVSGEIQRQHLKTAVLNEADFHLLMPDFVYSENCFSNVLKLSEKHKAIVRLNISVSEEKISSDLEKYRESGVLAIPAKKLATLALKHIHPGIKHWLATKEGYPNTHVVAWQGKNTLHMCSPHCTPIYMAAEVINSVDYQFPLDSILDKIIIGEIYCPKPDDEIVLVEISPENTRRHNDKRIDLKEFCRIFKWDTNSSLRQWSIFDDETIDAIDSDELNSVPWNDVEISMQKSIINNALKESMGV